MTENIPTNIKELTEMMASVIPEGPSTHYGLSVTGESYIEHSYGIKKPDKKAEAIICKKHWLDFLKEVEEKPNAKLYWRTKPEYEEFEVDEDGCVVEEGERRGRSYLRYLVSSKLPSTPRVLSAPNNPERMAASAYSLGIETEYLSVEN